MTNFIVCGSLIVMCNPCFSMNLKSVTGFVIGEALCGHALRPRKCEMKHMQWFSTHGMKFYLRSIIVWKLKIPEGLRQSLCKEGVLPFHSFVLQTRTDLSVGCGDVQFVFNFVFRKHLVKTPRTLTLVLEMPYLALELLPGKKMYCQANI